MKKLNALFLVVACAVPALPAAAQESVLYSFPDQTTGAPAGQLLLVQGALYGATTGVSPSMGTVFELKKKHGVWKETTVHVFAGGSDGAFPAAGLIADANGVLYGTTGWAGTYNGGTVFSLTKSGKKWKEQTLWNFGNAQTGDGAQPVGALLMDASGAIYGTTASGGAHNLGTVFKLTNAGGVWTNTVLHSFTGGRDGSTPLAGLVMDTAGVLYGTTNAGGTRNYGTVFALTPSGNGWSKSVLHSFYETTGDGRNPGYGSLALDSEGVLYGTTFYGGTTDWGTVFELVLSGSKWKEKILHTFGNGSDGHVAVSGVVFGKSGALYGTTPNGGAYTYGTVYQLAPSGDTWTETIVTSFPNFNGDGFFSRSGVTIDSNSGTIYGTTEQGGANGAGAVYQIVR